MLPNGRWKKVQTVLDDRRVAAVEVAVRAVARPSRRPAQLLAGDRETPEAPKVLMARNTRPNLREKRPHIAGSVEVATRTSSKRPSQVTAEGTALSKRLLGRLDLLERR